MNEKKENHSQNMPFFVKIFATLLDKNIDFVYNKPIKDIFIFSWFSAISCLKTKIAGQS